MKRGTKIGWALVALSIVISVTVIIASSSNAERIGDFEVDENGMATEYYGPGGSVTIPDGITSLAPALFANNDSITSLSIPGAIVSIGDGLCMGCTQLGSVTLGSGISSIPSSAFSGCTGLFSVSSIPAGVTSIADDAFSSCYSLQEISVSSGNSNYSSYDGCLYNGAGTRLILVPGGKASVTISDSCTSIESGAFADYQEDAVTIPETVTSIDSGAIPSSITIYGYADSAAETYAKNNGNPFIVIGPNPDPDPPEPSPTPTPTPTPTPESGSVTPSGGDTDNGDGTVTKADGTVVEKATGRIIRVGTGSTGANHAKDATPGTADGVDPVYFLCIAVFLGGAGTLVYTRVRKARYIKKKK